MKIVTPPCNGDFVTYNDIRYRVVGTDVQSFIIELGGEEAIYAESGSMIWFKNSTMTVGTTNILGGIGRKLTGSNFFLLKFQRDGDAAEVGVGGRKLGRVEVVQLEEEEELLCENTSYLASTGGVKISAGLQKKAGAALFGGEGFFLQRMVGPGLCFLLAGGALHRHHLAEGEEILVSPGRVAFFEGSVNYTIATVGKIKTFLFGGEGLFLARLVGPGHVWLQGTRI